MAVAGSGRREWQTNQEGMIDLVCLRELKRYLLVGLFEVGSIVDSNAVGAFAGFKPGLTKPVLPHLQLIGGDPFALLVLLQLSIGDLYLGRDDFDRLIGAIQNGVRDCYLVTPLPNLAD